jgi:NAD(P)H-dependent flavin oxidoreductase YrpB (nitropropane dioxygenase family)
MSNNQDLAAIIVTGWAFISTAGWLIAASKAAHCKLQLAKAITSKADLNDAYQRAHQEIADVRKAKVIIAEGYKSKDAECEILRRDKSALNERLDAICRKYGILRMGDDDRILAKQENDRPPQSQSTLR